jgi:hypothetical protein
MDFEGLLLYIISQCTRIVFHIVPVLLGFVLSFLYFSSIPIVRRTPILSMFFKRMIDPGLFEMCEVFNFDQRPIPGSGMEPKSILAGSLLLSRTEPETVLVAQSNRWRAYVDNGISGVRQLVGWRRWSGCYRLLLTGMQA